MAVNIGKIAYTNPFRKRQYGGETVTKVKVRVADISQDGEKEVYKEFEHRTPVKNVFENYEDLSRISGLIAKELIGDCAYQDKYSGKEFDVSKVTYEAIRDNGLTFFMSTDTGLRRTGLLSLFPALSTGIRLYSKMSEIEDKEKTKDQIEVKTKLLEKIKSGIEVVFKFIYRDKDWRKNPNLKPVFDASPYESDAFYEGSDEKGLNGRSYIDSISWAVMLFLQIINAKVDNKFVLEEEYRNQARKLTKWCLDYVNNAVLTVKRNDETDNNKEYDRPVGWNFSNIVPSGKDATEQRSLYFTYAAASMYLALFEEYKDIIDNMMSLNRAHAKKTTIILDDHHYYKDNFKQAEEAIDVYAKKLEKEIAKAKEVGEYEEEKEEWTEKTDYLKFLKDALAKLQSCDERKLEDYNFFNEEKSAEYNGKIYKVDELEKLGPMSRFKWNLEKISTDIWEEAKDILEDKFVYDDFNFENLANHDALESGGQTNALFAGLLYISICLYSTYDLVVRWTEDDKSGRFGKKAYDDMQNTMLLHVQRAQRFFDKLSQKGKAFGVDFLILRFSEDFFKKNEVPDELEDKVYREESNLTDNETAEKLRKQLIRITSLTPMLLKTNNLISQYVVQYPQKQMGEGIDKIGQKRFYDRNRKGNNKYRWFWESDGYHAMSNYYYVGAIFDFYAYYDYYERAYVNRYEQLRNTLIVDLDYSDPIRAYYQKMVDEKQMVENECKIKLDEMQNKHKKDLDEIKAQVKTSKTGRDLVRNINQVIMDSKYFETPVFFNKVIDGMRKQLAEELAEKYRKEGRDTEKGLVELKTPCQPKEGGGLLSLLEALAADVILPSAVKAKKARNDAKLIDKVGKGLEGEGLEADDFILMGLKQLINEGLISEAFRNMLDTTKWVFENKPIEEK